MLWKNSLAARQLIEKGSRWRVRNGRHIKIWHHSWLPTPNSFMVHTHLPNLSVEATVYKLLIQTEDGVVWNEGLIEANFWAEEAKTIQGIPLGIMDHDDKLIWSLTDKGEFTVKSTHQLALDQQ